MVSRENADSFYPILALMFTLQPGIATLWLFVQTEQQNLAHKAFKTSLKFGQLRRFSLIWPKPIQRAFSSN